MPFCFSCQNDSSSSATLPNSANATSSSPNCDDQQVSKEFLVSLRPFHPRTSKPQRLAVLSKNSSSRTVLNVKNFRIRWQCSLVRPWGSGALFWGGVGVEERSETQQETHTQGDVISYTGEERMCSHVDAQFRQSTYHRLSPYPHPYETQFPLPEDGSWQICGIKH